MKTVKIPSKAVVAMIGASSSGKSTFARQHFLPTEILSSDFFRGMVSDDENDQSASQDAFEILYFVLERRLARGKLTVVDATSVRVEDRNRLLAIAARYRFPVVAIVLRTPEDVCLQRALDRPDRTLGGEVVRRHIAELEGGLDGLEREGFWRVYVLASSEDVEIRRTAPVELNQAQEHAC